MRLTGFEPARPMGRTFSTSEDYHFHHSRMNWCARLDSNQHLSKDCRPLSQRDESNVRRRSYLPCLPFHHSRMFGGDGGSRTLNSLSTLYGLNVATLPDLPTSPSW